MLNLDSYGLRIKLIQSGLEHLNPASGFSQHFNYYQL